LLKKCLQKYTYFRDYEKVLFIFKHFNEAFHVGICFVRIFNGVKSVAQNKM